MSKNTYFDIHARPFDLPIKKIKKRTMTTLLACGIINPLGPTFNALTLDGVVSPGKQMPILHVMLNPFSQDLAEIGIATIGETWNPIQAITQLFTRSFGDCPTLHFQSSMLEYEDAVALHADFLATFDDGYSMLQRVRQFPGDPWNRVQFEMDEAREFMENPGNAQPSSNRRLSAEEAFELSRHLFDPKVQEAEIGAFFSAWDGAIKFQGGNFRKKDVLSMKVFLAHFENITLSCNFPDI
jgi:hypothetical protein